MNVQRNGTTVDYYSDDDYEWLGGYFQTFNGPWNAYHDDMEGKNFDTAEEAKEFLLVQIVKNRMKS